MTTLVIPGEPKPQGRPRFFRRGNFVGTYDPPDSASFKHKLALFAKESRLVCHDTPIQIKAVFVLSRPKRLMGKNWPDGLVWAPKRPDADNFLKAVLDGLNGIAWRDDGQVVDALVWKFYHEKTGVPRTEITITPLESNPSSSR